MADPDEARRSFRATGSSMLPSIWPGDELVVRRAQPRDLVPGALVAYPGGVGRVLVHRVLEAPAQGDLVIRGDHLTHLERVPRAGVAYVVLEVNGRFGHFRPGDPRGRLLARLALAESLPGRLSRASLRSLLSAAIVARHRLRRR